jgi:membrane-bound metal-dependent hydrolase YbcI (DUF457 family)
MYAINHAATALILKKNAPSAPMWALLVSVQLVEILWIIFNYTGLEYFSVTNGRLHLDYLPYSHSLFSCALIAILSFIVIRQASGNGKLALVFAIGVMSHVALDIIFHEKDIRLSPFSDTPAWGLGIIAFPVSNFILEFLYGIFCWWYFKGNKALLVTIIVFNMLDLPVMLASGDAVNIFNQYPFLLPTFILFQTGITWYFVWRYSRDLHGQAPVPVMPQRR